MSAPAHATPAAGAHSGDDDFASATTGLLVAELDGAIVSINPAMADLIGLVPSHAGRANLLALLDPPDQICDLVESLAATGSAPERVMSLNGGAGVRRIALTAAMLPSPGGAGGPAFLAIGRPPEGMATAPATLDDVSLSAASKQVSSMVAHDLNNVLGVILGASHLIAASPHDEVSIRRDLESLKAATTEAALIVRQLAAYGATRPSTPVSIQPGEALRRLQPTVSQLLGSPVNLEVCSTGGTLVGDPALFDDVVMSLALEARRTLGAADRVTLQLGASPAGEEWRLRLDTTSAPAVWDERAPAVRVAGGRLSVGPRLAHIAVERWLGEQGGRLQVDAGHPGFAVEVAWPRREAPQPRPAMAPRPEPGPATRTVLIVDDNVRLRQFVERLLVSRGYQVTAAADGTAALAAINAHQFDAVVTDVLMPDVSGWAVGEAVRQRTPQCGVVYVTGELLDGEGREARGGRSQLLLKPFTPTGLLDAVARACAGATIA